MGKKSKRTKIPKNKSDEEMLNRPKENETEVINKPGENETEVINKPEENELTDREKFEKKIKYEPEGNRTISKKTESYRQREDAKTKEEKRREILLKAISRIKDKGRE